MEPHSPPHISQQLLNSLLTIFFFQFHFFNWQHPTFAVDEKYFHFFFILFVDDKKNSKNKSKQGETTVLDTWISAPAVFFSDRCISVLLSFSFSFHNRTDFVNLGLNSSWTYSGAASEKKVAKQNYQIGSTTVIVCLEMNKFTCSRRRRRRSWSCWTKRATCILISFATTANGCREGGRGGDKNCGHFVLGRLSKEF